MKQKKFKKVFILVPLFYLTLMIFLLPYIIKYIISIDENCSTFVQFCIIPPIGAMAITIFGGLSSIVINQYKIGRKIVFILSLIVIVATIVLTMYYLKNYCTIILKEGLIKYYIIIAVVCLNISLPATFPIISDDLFYSKTIKMTILFAIALMLFLIGNIGMFRINSSLLQLLDVLVCLLGGGAFAIVIALINVISLFKGLKE